MDSADEPVDVSVLEALIDVRKQQELVDQLCQRAEDMKSAVTPAVYARVVADYAARRATLDHEAAPLVTRALAEYRKLRALHAKVQQAHDAATLDKDEVEFRHSLGEIDAATRDTRLAGPLKALSESAAELANSTPTTRDFARRCRTSICPRSRRSRAKSSPTSGLGVILGDGPGIPAATNPHGSRPT